MAYKTFVNGFPLNASEINNNLMNQAVATFVDAAARSTAISAPVEGQLTYLESDAQFYKFDGDAWVALPGMNVDGVAQSPNYFINGAMEINQRNDTVGASGYQFDRWRVITTGTGTFTPSGQTFSDDCPIPSWDYGNYLRIVTSGGDATTAHLFRQAVENVSTLSEQTATLSFYAKANTAANVAVSVRQLFGTGGSATVEINAGKVAVTTSWARYSVTFTVPSVAGKTVGAGSKLEPQIWVNGGSNFNAVTDSLGNQSATFDFWGVQLEAGSVATPFRRNSNSLQGEEAACERYYQQISGQVGFATPAADAILTSLNFRTQMRSSPSIGLTAPMVVTDGAADYTQSSANISIVVSRADTRGAQIAMQNFTGLTANRPYTTTVLSSKITLSSEL
jgi:hypothetical protein